MKKLNNKFVYLLLIIIILLSIVLIRKIESTPKYNQKTYDEIYSEYEKIVAKEKNTELKEKVSSNNETKIQIYENRSGTSYKVVATLKIPKINLSVPIIYETGDEYLAISPTKLFGPNPNEIGNFCIVGHNYKNNKHFSNLYKLENGDTVELTDRESNKLIYKVYDKFEVYETDMSPTQQNTKGKIELTLITCTNRANKRLVIKCRAT